MYIMSVGVDKPSRLWYSVDSRELTDRRKEKEMNIIEMDTIKMVRRALYKILATSDDDVKMTLRELAEIVGQEKWYKATWKAEKAIIDYGINKALEQNATDGNIQPYNAIELANSIIQINATITLYHKFENQIDEIVTADEINKILVSMYLDTIIENEK